MSINVMPECVKWREWRGSGWQTYAHVGQMCAREGHQGAAAISALLRDPLLGIELGTPGGRHPHRALMRRSNELNLTRCDPRTQVVAYES